MTTDKIPFTDENSCMLCPVCGFDCTHMEEAYTSQAGTNGRLDVHVVGNCEDGHRFMLSFHQHKGSTEVTMERLPDGTEQVR